MSGGEWVGSFLSLNVELFPIVVFLNKPDQGRVFYSTHKKDITLG